MVKDWKRLIPTSKGIVTNFLKIQLFLKLLVLKLPMACVCTHSFCLHVCMYPACMPDTISGQKSTISSFETGVKNGCEPCGCQELNPGLLDEQQIHVTSEPALQYFQYCSFPNWCTFEFVFL